MPGRIGFAGMTHLGLVSGVAASEKGSGSSASTPTPARIAALRQEELPVSEPQLDELVAKNAERICVSRPTPADLKACDCHLRGAGRCHRRSQGRAICGPINALLDRVFEAARSDAVIVVLSQVPPGLHAPQAARGTGSSTTRSRR